MIKILALETLFKRRKNALTGEEVLTHSGVDFARVVQPMEALSKVKGFKVDVIHDYPLEGNNLSKWEEIIKKYDVIYTSYIDNSLLYVAIKVFCDKHNKKFIMDLDDYIWGVSKNHPHYDDYKIEYDQMGRPHMSEALFKRTQILKDCNKITTTSRFLSYRIKEMTGRRIEDIEVFPNFVNLELYDYKKLIPKKNKDEIIIGYHGGGSHFDDLVGTPFIEALATILKRYPNVRFVTNGFFFPQLKERFGFKYRFRLAYADVYKFIDKLWPESTGEADIVVAPLMENTYAKCKSYIKFLEYGAGKKSGIYEKITPYTDIVENGVNGYLASTYDEWVEKLSYLIENEKERERIGEEAYKTVLKHQVKDNLKLYIDFFKKITKI